ncbi:MAG: DUF1015 domain-containing protein [Syntrophomonadaceae bacterium]|nr:DUF1015 domain-containing protein [Syntrophomonadaceae bacterium]
MAKITPFQGIRYNERKVNNLDEVVTPPYDIINPLEQEDFYQKHLFNIIRLELGKTFSGDTEKDNRYTRAAKTFSQWLQEEVLLNDPKPAFYLYQQEFDHNGMLITRTGFFARVELTDYSQGIVLPHEETMPKHKADRLELMRACNANFSPIFGLYNEPEGKIVELLAAKANLEQPEANAKDQFNVVHKLWAVDNPETINRVAEIFAPLQVFIADGHHRYETALHFKKESGQNCKPGANYVMMVLVNLTDPGLVIYPTHRLLKNLIDFRQDSLLEKIAPYFEIEPVLMEAEGIQGLIDKLAEKGKSRTAFGLFAGGDAGYLLALRQSIKPLEFAHSGATADWASLDVSILHNIILENILGIGSKQRANETNLTYTRSAQEAQLQVLNGQQQLAFFLNPTKISEVTTVAQAGEKMPQKSTYFYPKLITGLVINSLD